MPEMTQSGSPDKTKHRKKNRESHNEVERHRKKKINSGINRIGDLIPCSPALKQSKNMILDQAFKYITELKRQNDELLLNGGDQEQACEIKKLRRELSEIQRENGRYIELLKSNGICLYDDPTLHWKGNARSTKASLIVPNDQVQKLPLCLNGNQLSSANQGTAVHGITFNVGHNLQKQTANVVPVQRTCNLVTPITISGVIPLDKALQQNSASASTSSQHIELSLPVTTVAPTNQQTIHLPPSSTSPLSSLAASAGPPNSPSNHVTQENNVDCSGRKLLDVLTKSAASTCNNLPLPVTQPNAPAINLNSPPNLVQEKMPGAAGCVETVKDVVKGVFPGVDVDTSPRVPVNSRETSSSVADEAGSAGPLPSALSLETRWSVPSRLNKLKSGVSLTGIPSDENTQTTWTTLQLAGNTVQPLSRISSTIIPTPSTEQPAVSKDILSNRQVTACVNVTSTITQVNPVEKVIVKMSSYQPVPVQSLITQPQLQSTTSILPLNPPVQVIQVGQPFGAAINSAPANQNIIFLQPPAPAPCPPVPKPAMGQQIVFIQAATNQNPVPLVSAQPSPSVVMPINAANPAACPTNPVQSAMVQQTHGGKHLVHILPRPTTVQLASTAQQVPVSTAISNQQPPTISLNGQLFALQPMTPAAGASNAMPMQIIQPTTSEDPNTNVALNTFGALANLSQNISHIAGQSCLQFTLNPPAASALTTSNIPVSCVSVAGPSVPPATAETPSVLPVPSLLAKPSSVKPIGGTAPSTKPKKAVKKAAVKKGASVKKDSTAATKSDLPCLEVPKEQSSNTNQRPVESASILPTSLVPVQEESDASAGCSQAVVERDKTQEASTSSASLEANVLLESVHEEPLPSDGSRDLVTDEVSIAHDEQRPPTVAPECFKANIGSGTAHFNHQSVEESLVVVVPQDEIGLTTDGNSETATASRSCLTEGDTASLTATDLLDVQILTEDPNGKYPPGKATTKDLDSHGMSYRDIKSKESASSEPTKPSSSIVQAAQNPSSISEQESGSCAASRQTDSPLSNSSVSSRNFSVASMLPDTSRADMASGVSLVPPLNACGFSEQNDIVAVAAKALFDQESLSKGRSRTQANVGDAVPRNVEAEASPTNCPLPLKPHSAKENISHVPPTSASFNTLGTKAHACADRLVDKSTCPLGVNPTSLSLQISASQSQSVTSLSINNLLHQGGITHSVLNCASMCQTSEHIPLPMSTNPSVTSSTYESQTDVTSALSEYTHEHLHSMNSADMQVTQAADSLLKQQVEGRKESNKRTAHVDGLLSTAKRQKQCHAPVRLERLQPSDNVAEQNDILGGHVSSDSSSVSGSIQGHREGISNLFPSNNFVNSNMRQTDIRCSSQPSISEHGQMGNQHLQSLHQQQQLHNSNPYLKPPQQAGHMRDQHLMYQQQQQLPLVDSSLRAQSHNIQQQRMMQQEVQMQKKRTNVQGSQAARLSLQQKHLSEQNRQKSAQPHRQQMQQQQQLPPHFGSGQPEKTCENNTPSRGLHGAHSQSHVSQDIRHQHQQEIGSRSQGPVVSSEHLPSHNQIQRLMTSRSLEQQMVSQASIVPRPANMTCAPHRQERNRVSSYSAEALIGKSTSNSEQRLGVSIQTSRVSEQLEMRKYLDISRNKVIPAHNIQGRMSVEHVVNMDPQRLPDCQTFKLGGLNQQQPSNFDIQTSRNNDGGATSSMRGLQSQSYRISQNPNSAMDRQKHLQYQVAQEVPLANTLPIRDENSCHQSFMQSLFAPHIGEQANQRSISGHQRPQFNSSSSLEFSCPPARDTLHLRRENEGQNRESCDLVMGQVTSRNNSLNIPFSSSSSADIQGRNTSPHSSMQKSNSVRPADGQGAKNQLNIQVSINMHGVVHPPLPHQSVPHVNIDQRQTMRHANPPVAQRSRHPLQEDPDSKARQPERNRSGNQRHGNMFDSALPHLPLAGPSSMILGRQQPGAEKRAGLVRFMPDSPQVATDNTAPDQHTLAQNFGFPFIPEGPMNPPINANASFIPPVTQTPATRTAALIPVDPQNTLPSFYPPYSPAHPSLSNDLAIPYFPNQIFPNPSTEKPNSSGLNNRFGSILSPPRPVGFSQTTFPLLPEMPPMHMANPSHLSNFNLTSLFPEIATALPADGSAMSPLLSISHSAASDSSKTSNRPAHNISHILGHDSSSAV
ncbi:basic helix-loop-helix domain-containing protein USF3 [Pseudophryne corroboree]|uniref:basic helix-loop-helix domain-containing protein USF3 n=1 Tax=Pseudophryne corroboree TaxID=495146 RepID=UPI0030821646